MPRFRILCTLAAVLGISVLTAGPAAAQTDSRHQNITYYVSIGDSLAQGVQADPTTPTGTSIITDEGYPDQLYGKLVKSNPGLRLKKFGCPGETTTTLITGGICPYPGGSQLTAAIAFLRAHRGHVAFLTFNMGSNDVLPCVDPSTGIDQACFLRSVQTVGVNLDKTLRILHSALDPRTSIAAGMTYYDPILAFYPSSPTLARQSVVATEALNAVESVQYLLHGFRVAQVARAFQTGDFTVPANSPLPVNVGQICSLTWMCRFGNIHPNAAGYQLIADTFAATLRYCRR